MGALLEPFFYIIGFVVDIYFKVVVVEIVLHWLIYFKILEANNKYAQKTMEILERQRAGLEENRRENSAGIRF